MKRGKNAVEKPCPLPFSQLVFTHSGQVLPCCMRPDYVMGKLGKDNLEELWNGERIKALRREFLEGNPVSCARQIKHLGCNRDYDSLLEHTEFKEHQTRPPRRLELRLNGQCNLECIMCDVWEGPNGYFDKIGFWETAPRELFPFTVEMHVLGGEPFIQKDTFKLIDSVHAVNPKCAWSFITNAHWRFNDFIRSKLDLIEIRTISVSLDSVDPAVYARIRKKGSLDRVLETIDALVEYREKRASEKRPIKLALSTVVQKHNWEGVGAFFSYAKSRDLPVWPLLLEFPVNLSLYSEPKAVRERALAHFKEVRESAVEKDKLDLIIRPLEDTLDPNQRLERFIRLNDLNKRTASR